MDIKDIDARINSLKAKYAEAYEARMRAQVAQENAIKAKQEVWNGIMTTYKVSTTQEVKDLMLLKFEELLRLTREAEEALGNA